MALNNPKIPNQLHKPHEFHSYVQEHLSEELPLIAIKSDAVQIESMELNGIEIHKSVFNNCTFRNCSFADAVFVDVIFQSCDFSGSKFTDAYFERCHFSTCKCIGADMHGSVLKHTVFEQSNVKYAYFDKTKLTDVLFDHIDFTESSMTEAKLKRFEAKDTIFFKNNFFKTMLANIDFSDNEFSAPIVSSPPVELKGAIVNMFQAADLIGLWGIIVNGN